MVYEKDRIAYLQALGGQCVKCGEHNFAKLEVHDISGEHKGADNKQRLLDIQYFKETGKVKPGRYILCVRCHDYVHGNDYLRTKQHIEDKMRELHIGNSMAGTADEYRERECPHQGMKAWCDGVCRKCNACKPFMSQEDWLNVWSNNDRGEYF